MRLIASSRTTPMGHSFARTKVRPRALSFVLAAGIGCLVGMNAPARAQAAAPAAEASPAAQPVEAAQPAGSVKSVADLPPAVGAGTGSGIALAGDRQTGPVLHVGADAGAGFDTNPYSLPQDNGKFVGDMVIRVRPSAQLEVPGSLLSFRSGAMLDVGLMPGIIDASTRTLPLPLFQSLVTADLELNRQGAFNFALGDSISWNNDPGFVVTGSYFNRLINQLRAGLGFRPGGGALEMRLGYTFDFNYYVDIAGVGGPIAQGVFNNMTNALSLRTDYKFLPKTGAYLVLSGGWNVYPFTTQSPMSFPVSATLGLQGQILQRLAGLISVGYSNPLVVNATGVTTGAVVGVVGQGELQWQPSPVTRIAGGFQRSFSPAPLYQFLGNNRFYLAVNQTLGGRFNLGLNAGYSILEFGNEITINGSQLTNTPNGRLDGHLDANGQLAYFFNDWFSVALADRVNWRVTNASDATVAAAGGTARNLGFLRNETMLLVSIKY